MADELNPLIEEAILFIQTLNRQMAFCGELYTEAEQKFLRHEVSALLSTLGTNIAEGGTYDKKIKSFEIKIFPVD